MDNLTRLQKNFYIDRHFFSLINAKFVFDVIDNKLRFSGGKSVKHEVASHKSTGLILRSLFGKQKISTFIRKLRAKRNSLNVKRNSPNIYELHNQCRKEQGLGLKAQIINRPFHRTNGQFNFAPFRPVKNYISVCCNAEVSNDKGKDKPCDCNPVGSIPALTNARSRLHAAILPEYCECTESEPRPELNAVGRAEWRCAKCGGRAIGDDGEE